MYERASVSLDLLAGKPFVQFALAFYHVTDTDDAYGIAINDFEISSPVDVTAFSLSQQTGEATINATNSTVAIEVENGTDVGTLMFILSSGAAATVGTVAQISGTTANDFTNGVTYTIT